MALRSARGTTACGWASHLSVELQSSAPSPAADRQRNEACPTEGQQREKQGIHHPGESPSPVSQVPGDTGITTNKLFSCLRESL